MRHFILVVFCWAGLVTHSWADAPSGRVPLAELYVHTSAEYRALCHQAYNTAGNRFRQWAPLLEKREDGRAYLPGSEKPVAIILDLDETVISNSGFQAYMATSGAQYSYQLWDAWVDFQAINKAAGAAVPGAVDFLKAVEELGVTPIFISNRRVGQEEGTIKTMERLGIDVENIEQRLFLKPSQQLLEEQNRARIAKEGLAPGSVSARQLLEGEGEKEARRRMMQDKYDVVAYFGDVYGDFEPFLEMAESSKELYQQRQEAAEEHHFNWGSVWFILPNPMYGSWSVEKAVPKDGIDSALNDYGFSVYLRGRRALKK